MPILLFCWINPYSWLFAGYQVVIIVLLSYNFYFVRFDRIYKFYLTRILFDELQSFIKIGSVHTSSLQKVGEKNRE